MFLPFALGASILDNLLVRGRSTFTPLHSALEPCVAWTCVCYHALSVTYVLLCLEDIVFMESTSPVVLKIFPLPLPHWALSCERRGLMKTSHLRLSTTKSLTLCTTLPSCGSLCYSPSATRRGLSDDGCAMIYGYTSMLLGVILLLCAFRRTIVAHFP